MVRACLVVMALTSCKAADDSHGSLNDIREDLRILEQKLGLGDDEGIPIKGQLLVSFLRICSRK
jgi:hypothetical protein